MDADKRCYLVHRRLMFAGAEHRARSFDEKWLSAWQPRLVRVRRDNFISPPQPHRRYIR